MSEFTKDDFTGFTLKNKNIHSSSMNFVAVSTGDRYTKYLSPDSTDTTVNNVGQDGSLYFKTNYTSRKITIDIAYDNMSDDDIQSLYTLMNFRDMDTLVFDEEPYCEFYVKPAAPPVLKYICFDEGGERVYKGEGTLTFITYDPFTYTNENSKYLIDYTDWYNFDEWAQPSKLLYDSSDLSKKFLEEDNLRPILDGTITEFSSNKIQTIQDYKFAYCNSLTRVNCPNVTRVGRESFGNCSNMYSFEAPQLNYIGAYAFAMCHKLGNLVISDSTEKPSFTIKEGAFIGCHSLREVRIEANIITFSNPPQGSPPINYTSKIFFNCTNLYKIYLKSNSKVLGLTAADFLGTHVLVGGAGAVYVPANLLSEYQSSYGSFLNLEAI